MYKYFRQPSNIIKNILKLSFERISKIQAFHCAYLSFSNKGQYKLDRDAVSAIIDTGCPT